jgi:hypothetical protein
MNTLRHMIEVSRASKVRKTGTIPPGYRNLPQILRGLSISDHVANHSPWFKSIFKDDTARTMGLTLLIFKPISISSA